MALAYSQIYCSKCGSGIRGWFRITHKGGSSQDLESIHQRFDDLPMKIECANCVDEMTGTDTIEDCLRIAEKNSYPSSVCRIGRRHNPPMLRRRHNPSMLPDPEEMYTIPPLTYYQPLYKIVKERVICTCDEYEAESIGEDHSLISCYACRKMQELLIQLHKDGYIK